MAKQPDIVGLFTGISDKPIDPTTMTQAQQRGAMRSNLFSSARQGMTNAFGRETKEQKMQAQRADYLAKFDSLPVEEQKKAVYQLQAAGETAMAGQLASRVGAKASEEMVKNFANKTTEEKKNIINVLRSQGKTALAGQLASQMSTAVTQAQAQERLDIQRLATEQRKTELGAADKKYIRQVGDEADVAGSQVSTLLGLANDYSRTRPMGGVGGKAMDKWKATFGTQDEVSRIKTQFQSVVNTNIINSLPPGVASDKDIEMAKSGYMNNSWSAEQIEEFLRGQAKLSAFVAEKKNAKAKWVSDRGGDSSGFNEHWRKIISQEGYKEMVSEKYGLSAYRIPAPDVEFNPDLVPTGNTSGQANPLGRRR